jgi:hypothetical protein
MFVLRRIAEGELEINTCLGIEYVLVMKEKNRENFGELTKLWKEEDLKDVYGLVCFDNTDSIMPLYKNSTYYIMTNSGRTFANISYE